MFLPLWNMNNCEWSTFKARYSKNLDMWPTNATDQQNWKREMFPKKERHWCSGRRSWGATCHWENHLVQSILGDNLETFRFLMIFLQNEETQEDFGVGDEVLDVLPFDERGEVLEWGSDPKSTQSRIPRDNQWTCLVPILYTLNFQFFIKQWNVVTLFWKQFLFRTTMKQSFCQ